MQQPSSVHYYIRVKGQLIPTQRFGNGPLPCLFIGPGELYFPSMPAELGKVLTMFSADRYFTYPKRGERVSREEIESLTFTKYLEHYEEIRKALNLKKLAVMGPSALGIAAHVYAEQHPDKVTHAFLLGTPTSTADLYQLEMDYMEGNYKPITRTDASPLPITSSSDWSTEKWARFQERLKNFTVLKEKKDADPDELLIQELVAFADLYERNPDSEETLRLLWEGFNTTMRDHFFGDEQMIKSARTSSTITVPTLVISGIHDGIAPFYDFGDLLTKKVKKEGIQQAGITGTIYQVVMEAGHSPQRASRFTDIIKAWLDWVEKNPHASGSDPKWVEILTALLSSQESPSIDAKRTLSTAGLLSLERRKRQREEENEDRYTPNKETESDALLSQDSQSSLTHTFGEMS